MAATPESSAKSEKQPEHFPPSLPNLISVLPKIWPAPAPRKQASISYSITSCQQAQPCFLPLIVLTGRPRHSHHDLAAIVQLSSPGPSDSLSAEECFPNGKWHCAPVNFRAQVTRTPRRPASCPCALMGLAEAGRPEIGGMSMGRKLLSSRLWVGE